MTRPRALTLSLFVLACVGFPEYLLAQNIVVDIGPGICSKSGTSPLNIGGTCGNITISPAAAGNARVEAIDGSSDILRVVNTVIKADQPVANFHIIIKRDFVPGPQTATDVKVYYKTSASGSWSPVNTNNSLTVNSSVAYPIGTPARQMGSILVPGSTSPFTQLPSGTEWVPPPHLEGDRALTIDLAFTLAAANDLLRLPTGITLKNSLTPVDKEDR